MLFVRFSNQINFSELWRFNNLFNISESCRFINQINTLEVHTEVMNKMYLNNLNYQIIISEFCGWKN
jgi:hypothetical protein